MNKNGEEGITLAKKMYICSVLCISNDNLINFRIMKTIFYFTTCLGRAAMARTAMGRAAMTLLLIMGMATGMQAGGYSLVSNDDNKGNDGNGSTLSKPLTLYDNLDNTAVLNNGMGSVYDVTLSGYTLKLDGAWNTLCLPFTVKRIDGTPLEGFSIMELDTETAIDGHKTGFEKGTLYINFKDAKIIEAGKPYLVRKKSLTQKDITNPMFKGVMIESYEPKGVSSSDGMVSFEGLFRPLVIAKSGDKTKLYMADKDMLRYPEISFNINAFRAYFQMDRKLVNSSLGDVNGDGMLSVTDVTYLVDYILGNGSSNFINENADVNWDGLISVADVTALVDMVLNGGHSEIKIVVNTGDGTIIYDGGGSGPARGRMQ